MFNHSETIDMVARRTFKITLTVLLASLMLLASSKSFASNDDKEHGETVTISISVIDPNEDSNPVGATYPGFRGSDQTIAYTPEYDEETGTNQYGTEIVVEDGIVTLSSSNDSVIPENGFVLSANGSSQEEPLQDAMIGSEVTLDKENLTATIKTDVNSHIRQSEYFVEQAEENIQNSYNQFINAPLENATEYLENANSHAEEANKLVGKDDDKASDKADKATSEAQKAIYHTIPSFVSESRGVWYSFSPDSETPESISGTLDEMKDAGINEVNLSVGDYYYNQSNIAEEYGIGDSNNIEKDLLDDFITKANKRDIEIYAWVDVLKTGGGDATGAVLESHPEWTAVEQGKVEQDQPTSSTLFDDYWIDIANPTAKQFLIDVYKEMMQEYDFAGINIDYVRYPTPEDGDEVRREETYNYGESAREKFESKYSVDPVSLNMNDELWETWGDWIEDLENKFVKDLYKEMKKIDNDTVVTYSPEPNEEEDKIGQWEDFVDVIIPQAYTSSALSVKESMEKHKSRLDSDTDTLFYSGIWPVTVDLGPYQTVEQVNATRDVSFGATIFSFNGWSQPITEALKEGPWRKEATSPTAQPLESVNSLLESIEGDIDEVYLPREGMNADVAKIVKEKIENISKDLKVPLPRPAYKNVNNEISELMEFIESKEEIDSTVVKRLHEKLRTATKYISYAKKSESLKVSDLKKSMNYFQEKDEISDNSVIHDLKLHLTSVEHFIENNNTKKVIKHLKSFNELLKYQNENNLISNDVYNQLNTDTSQLINLYE